MGNLMVLHGGYVAASNYGLVNRRKRVLTTGVKEVVGGQVDPKISTYINSMIFQYLIEQV